MVLLQLKSNIGKLFAQEEIYEPEKFPSADKQEDNVVFIAKQFNATDFQRDTIEVLLRGSKYSQRRKRKAIEADVKLTVNANYRTAQMNTDEFGVGNTLTKAVM